MSLKCFSVSDIWSICLLSLFLGKLASRWCTQLIRCQRVWVAGLLSLFSVIALLFVSVDRALTFTWQTTLFKQLGPPSWEYPQSMRRSHTILFKLPAVAGSVLLPMNANLWRTLQGRAPALWAVPCERLRLREALNTESTYLLPASLLPLLKLSALLLAFLSSMASTDFAFFSFIVVIIC